MQNLHESSMKECAETTETNSVNQEKRFARIVAAEVAGALQVNYGDRDIVVKLLTTQLENILSKRGSLLEQYLHTQLDILARSIKDRFGIDDKNLGVNYTYATHAKLNDIMERIQEIVESTEPKPNFDGNV